ncbi:kinase-like protein [Piedraia hortae CBS 480.64]|uniref:Kinase-like protein n=1 Tax=Piedraia hortae CBS 480.64 TaxID=1314780 RepID=A0A6A7BT77_9PEZI|nr:kinase-like protein [Piedraia hortae CBS 480.64]
MPPPRLPLSATWHNGLTADGATGERRKTEEQQSIPRLTQNHGNGLRARPPVPLRDTGSSISAIVKDKDDLAADEEMRRLSGRNANVGSAARTTEALQARALPRSPVSPASALQGNGRLVGGAALNIFERGEITEYENQGIYFTGAKQAKKIIGSLGSPEKKDETGNYGYDDERGDYNIVLGDHLAYRYEVVDVLGKGSFGQVVRCIDHKKGGIVAVKIIRNKKRFHQQALIEVGILKRLGEWDPDGAHATLSTTGSFYFRNHLCIVTPCLSINLYEFIRAHNFVGFSLVLIRRIARQLLACLTLLQQKRIIHCDLKPENILLCDARKADVRVIDFGSSCREEEKVYTYIQSRFYRSPEVILGSSYGLGIDMWSFGCILAELFTGYPLFPGENEQEQLACIMEVFGPPDRHLVERCTRKKVFFDSMGKPRVAVNSKNRRRRPSSKTLAQALKTDDEAFVDFVARCLRWDPDRRMKPAEAVAHPFITNVPMTKRQVSDDARRSVAGRSSPVKRPAGNAFAQKPRALPETPRAREVSPAKNATRRQSGTGPASATSGVKRGCNGGPQPMSQRQKSGGFAQLAARESMGGNQRWRA